MMLKKALFLYSALTTLLITVSSGKFVFFFLPILTYFLFKATRLVAGGAGEKLLTYYSFVVSSIMVITGFISARSPLDLAAAALFSPLFFYFLTQIFPKRNRAIILSPKPKETTLLPAETGRVDIDRRMFLKAIASAGVSVFLFAVFTKKAEAAFFGSVPGPGKVSLKDASGNVIDPAVKHPTDGYRLTEFEDGAPYNYAGYLNKDGAWFIVRDDGASFRYAKGSSNFATNWTNRTSLSYDYYDNVF